LSDRVFSAVPYASRGKRDVRNADDFLFRNGGKQLLLDMQPSGAGFVTTFDAGVQI